MAENKIVVRGIYFTLIMLPEGMGFFVENKKGKRISIIFNKNSERCEQELCAGESYVGPDYREANTLFQAMEVMLKMLNSCIVEANEQLEKRKKWKKDLIEKTYQGDLEKAKRDNRFSILDEDIKFFESYIKEIRLFIEKIIGSNDLTAKNLSQSI